MLTVKRPVQEVSIYGTDGHAQVVGSLQRVIAIVVVSRILKVQAAFDVVAINILIDAHVFAVVDLLSGEEKAPVDVVLSTERWRDNKSDQREVTLSMWNHRRVGKGEPRTVNSIHVSWRRSGSLSLTM